MSSVHVTLPTNTSHCNQIVTGFLMLKKQGWNIRLEDCSAEPTQTKYKTPVVLAEYRGVHILYDLCDGYPEAPYISRFLDWSDICFKRSYSPDHIYPYTQLSPDKIIPLGFNYLTYYPSSPFLEPAWKSFAKSLLGRASDRDFYPEAFEGTASLPAGQPKILFLARLWDDTDSALSAKLLEERSQINQMRIEIIRTLREIFGSKFTGGLQNSPFSRTHAPDLLVPDALTDRKAYLKQVHSSDICIGSSGLHRSIGWKTGEYVAAAKAIVLEEPRYSVPGDFLDGSNYLSFRTSEECILKVRQLCDNPQQIYEMGKRNEAYYHAYLRPDVLVRNTLEYVDSML